MPPTPLHVVQISFFVDPAGRSAAQLLEAWPTLVDVAEAAARPGNRVSLIQASTHSEHLSREGVDYFFLPFGDAAARNCGRSTYRELLQRLAPDVLHVHGLESPRETSSLAALAPDVPIVIQDHASRVPRIWRRTAWRRAMSAAAGVAFCAKEQARPFVKSGLFSPQTALYEIPESTCRFAPGDRNEARRLTGIEGDPAVLWVGHLDANKDPLTVLEGISSAARNLPRLQFYCCFGAAPLRRQIQARVAMDPHLRGKVHLLGQVPHERIQMLMRAADIFVLGSHREGSGYSLIEALACGLPPAVTDIASFRSLTGGGAVGKLWPCGDSLSAGAALQAIADRISCGTRAEVRAHFERELSFDALGSKLTAMYLDVLHRARRAGAKDHLR